MNEDIELFTEIDCIHAEDGATIGEVRRKAGISAATFTIGGTSTHGDALEDDEAAVEIVQLRHPETGAISSNRMYYLNPEFGGW